MRETFGLALRAASLLLGASLLTLAAHGGAPAEVVGYALLPADTYAPGPACGAFDSAGTRGATRFPSQPVQGFSALSPLGGGAFLALADNGFGNKKNSPDFLLRLYTLRPDFKRAGGGAGTVAVDGAFVQLSDPDRKVDFLLVNENTKERLLTGADFDPESLAVAKDGTLWIGEEFGPYLLHFDRAGRLLSPPIPVPDPRQGKDPARDFVRSPDHPHLVHPGPGKASPANLGRSRGFENMALGADGTHLYPMLEGPLAGDAEDLLRILEFDLATERFTGRSWSYRLTAPYKEFEGHLEAGSVRDMTTVNAHQFLVVENDTGHAAQAQFKKVFLIDLSKADARGVVPKEEVADLMALEDPRNLGGHGTPFTLPYMCIESVAVVDASTILVANDNNFPQDGARRVGVKDPEELVLIGLARKLDLAAGAVAP